MGLLLRATLATEIFAGEWTQDVEGLWRTLFVLRSLNKHLGADITMKSGCWSNNDMRQRILDTVKQLFKNNVYVNVHRKKKDVWPTKADGAEPLLEVLTNPDDLAPPPANLPKRAKTWTTKMIQFYSGMNKKIWPSPAQVSLRGVAVTRQLQWLLENFNGGACQKMMEKLRLDKTLKKCREVVGPKFRRTIEYANEEKYMQKLKNFQKEFVWKNQEYLKVDADSIEKLGKLFDSRVLR